MNYYKAAKKARKDAAAAEAEGQQLAEPTFLWLENKLRPDLNAAVEQMKTTAKETSGYDASVKVAGKIAIAMIASWAESLIGEQQRLWFEKSERDLGWEVQARETAAWEAARTSEARDSLVHELDTLQMSPTCKRARLISSKPSAENSSQSSKLLSSTTSIRRGRARATPFSPSHTDCALESLLSDAPN